MRSSTKRSGIAAGVVFAVVVASVAVAASATARRGAAVAVVVTPGLRAAVVARSVGDWPISTLTTTAALPMAVPVPVPTAAASTTTVQTLSKGVAASHSAAAIPTGPSGVPPVPFVPPITVTPGLAPVTTPTPTPPTTEPPSTGPSASHIVVTLQIDPPSPRVGETVHFILNAVGGAWCCSPTVTFSDGTPTWIALGEQDTGPCPALSGMPSATYSLTHVFAAPGVYTIQGEASGGGTCFAPPNFEWVYGRMSTAVTVRP